MLLFEKGYRIMVITFLYLVLLSCIIEDTFKIIIKCNLNYKLFSLIRLLLVKIYNIKTNKTFKMPKFRVP